MRSLEEKIAHLKKKGKKSRSLLKVRRRSLQAFSSIHAYSPNLKKPTSYNEKLLYRKLNQRSLLRSLWKYACKYEVRSYIQDIIGREYLVPLIQVIEKPSDFNLSELPENFIMKASHGSGWNYIIRGKSDISENKLRDLIASWLSCNYSKSFTGESQYEDIPPKVVIEELLTDETGRVPSDYRFHCFGKGYSPKVVIQVDSSRDEDITRSHFTEEWVPIPVEIKYPSPKNTPKKPENLKEMVRIAKLISSRFDYCRVDLYSFNSKIYFGEITFLPINALGKFSPKEMDLEFGSWLTDFNLKKDPIIKRFIR